MKKTVLINRQTSAAKGDHQGNSPKSKKKTVKGPRAKNFELSGSEKLMERMIDGQSELTCSEYTLKKYSTFSDKGLTPRNGNIEKIPSVHNCLSKFPRKKSPFGSSSLPGPARELFSSIEPMKISDSMVPHGSVKWNSDFKVSQ